MRLNSLIAICLNQLTYGVVSEGVFAESLRKFCGKFAETTFYCARKGRGNSTEISRKFAENFLQWPLPERPHKWTVDICLNHFASAGPKCGCLNVGAWNPQESGRKAPLSCNAAFSMLQCSFSLVAAQHLVKMTSALQKSQCCSATSAAQHSKNCSATFVFACGMLQGWGLEGWGLGLADRSHGGLLGWVFGCVLEGLHRF